MSEDRLQGQLKTFVWIDARYYKGMLVAVAYNVDQAKDLIRQEQIDFLTENDLDATPIIIDEPKVVAYWGIY